MGIRQNVEVEIAGIKPSLDALRSYGTVVLKPHVVNGKNILAQGDVAQANTKYVIVWNFDLDGEEITMPEGCLIELAGGSLKNGTLVGNSTVLMNESNDESLLDVQMEGTWVQSEKTLNADEEDITNERNVLQFKDKTYDASAFSGLGRVYLRKNIVNGANVLTQSMINKSNTIYHIQYDYSLIATNPIESTSSGYDMAQETYYAVAIIQKQGLNTMKAIGDCYFRAYNDNSVIGTEVAGESPYDSGNVLLCVDCESATEAQTPQPLSYTVDEVITVPSGCVLVFEGGSLKNGKLAGNGTIMKGVVRLSDVVTSGTFVYDDTHLAAVAKSGDYDDLDNKPTNVSVFTNDAGYMVRQQGSERPQHALQGEMFFDTTLGKPIWWRDYDSTWVDATGTAIVD